MCSGRESRPSLSVLHHLMTFLFGSRHFLRRGHGERFARTRGQGSQALLKCRLVEEKQNHRGLTGSILDSYPAPVRNKYCSSRSRVVWTTCQSNPHRTPVDKYDFIFIEMLVCRNSVSRWHLLCTDHERVRPSSDGVDLEDERLFAK